MDRCLQDGEIRRRGRSTDTIRAVRKSYYHIIVLSDPCVWCGEYTNRPTIEHIHPRVNGGPKKEWCNIAGACARCNNRRGDWSLLEFLMRKQRDDKKKWCGQKLLKPKMPVVSIKELSPHTKDWHPLHSLLGISPQKQEFVI